MAQGDQSGVGSLVKATNTLHSADPRMLDMLGEKPWQKPIAATEQIRQAQIDVASKVETAVNIVADYDRLTTPPEMPGGGDLNSVRVEVTRADETKPKSVEQVGAALRGRRNAAGFLTETLERELVDFVKAHFDMSYERISKRYDHWEDAEIAHDIYVPASVVESSQADQNPRGDNRRRKKPRLIDVIKTPYSRAISDTICTYNMAVFGGNPVFRIEATGRRGKSIGAKILEQELHYNMRRIGFEANLYQMTLDDNRYGLSPVAILWGKDGNQPVNIDPWNYFPDPRVTAQNRHEAAFVGYRGWASRTALHRRGVYDNLDRLSQLGKAETSPPPQSWQCNTQFKEAIRGQSIDPTDPTAQTDQRWGLGAAHVLNALYVFMSPEWLGIPGEFGLYRIVVADEKTVVMFDTSPYRHGQIPILQGDGSYDAHKTFASGVYDMIMPLQRFQDWLLRSRVENVQSMVQSRMIADPSRINILDILNPNSARLIRTMPGQNPKDALLPVAIPDATKGYWADLDTAGQLMNRVTAAGDTAQGIQSETQRTATEIARLTALGQQRLGTQARLKSARTMRPMARQMIYNLQDFGVDGGIVRLPKQYTDDPEGWYEWKRTQILGDYDYQTVDGSLPVDPTQNTEVLTRALKTIAETGTGAEWKVGRFIEEIIRSLGFYDIEEWRQQGAPMPQVQNQVVPDEQIRREVERGNLVSAGAVVPNAQQAGVVPGMGAAGRQPSV